MRRIIQVILIFLGIAPAAWAACILGDDPRRAGVLMALAVLGWGINGLSLARPHFGPRWPLRIIAFGVGLAVMAGVMAAWQWIRTELLPDTPLSAVGRREVLQQQMTNLIWIAFSVGYLLASLFILPIPRPKAPPSENPRIDFRTYGKE